MLIVIHLRTVLIARRWFPAVVRKISLFTLQLLLSRAVICMSVDSAHPVVNVLREQLGLSLKTAFPEAHKRLPDVRLTIKLRVCHTNDTASEMSLEVSEKACDSPSKTNQLTA